MTDAITFYHNPRCSKSRAALELLRARGAEPEVILYLQQVPDAKTLRQLLSALALPARALLRTGEEEYRALNLADPNLTEEALIAAMVRHPKLIERPIAVCGKRAVIGRPPENVLQLLT